MAECHEWDDIYDQRNKEIKENEMKSTTAYDDQFTVHPDDEKFTLLDMHPRIEDDIPEDIGVFEEDPLTEDFPFEIKVIFWIMVSIVVAWATGIF